MKNFIKILEKQLEKYEQSLSTARYDWARAKEQNKKEDMAAFASYYQGKIAAANEILKIAELFQATTQMGSALGKHIMK